MFIIITSVWLYKMQNKLYLISFIFSNVVLLCQSERERENRMGVVSTFQLFDMHKPQVLLAHDGKQIEKTVSIFSTLDQFKTLIGYHYQNYVTVFADHI